MTSLPPTLLRPLRQLASSWAHASLVDGEWRICGVGPTAGQRIPHHAIVGLERRGFLRVDRDRATLTEAARPFVAEERAGVRRWLDEQRKDGGS